MAPLFYRGVWRIVNMLYSKKKNINYFQEACFYFNINPKSYALSPSNQWLKFPGEPLEIKSTILTIVAKLLQKWPFTFINFCNDIGVTRSVLNPHNPTYLFPYWLWVISKKEINTFSYRVNENEIVSVLEYMLKNNIKISRGKLAKILGNDESMKLNNKNKFVLQLYQKQQQEKFIK
jgi:hypothetical protein